MEKKLSFSLTYTHPLSLSPYPPTTHSLSLTISLSLPPHTQVIHRDRHDEEITADILAGDCAMGVLESKMTAMQSALEDAKALGAGYSLLIEVTYCTVLHGGAVCCSIVCCTGLYYIVLYCIILNYMSHSQLVPRPSHTQTRLTHTRTHSPPPVCTLSHTPSHTHSFSRLHHPTLTRTYCVKSKR